MTRIGSLLRQRWPAVAAVAVLLAVALTAGTLFAANGRPPPELPAQIPPPASDDATAPKPATDLPAAPPAPERVSSQPDDGDQIETDLPPIAKVPPAHPNLDANLNQLAEQAQVLAQQANTTDGGGNGEPAPPAQPVLVTFYIAPEQVADVRQFLEDNDVFVRNVGEDYIEAHVPPSLLAVASELPGVRHVNTVISPRPLHGQSQLPSQSVNVSQGVASHGADAWHRAGYRGHGVKVGVIDTGFEGIRRLLNRRWLHSVAARCYIRGEPEPTSSLEECERHSYAVRGTATAEALVDVAPSVQLYISNPSTKGDTREAVDWMVEQGVSVIAYPVGRTPDGPGDGTSPFSNSPLRTIDAAVANGVVWVNDVGNLAGKVWYGAFSNPDGTTLPDGSQVHKFAAGDVGNSFTAEQGEDVFAYMRWEGTWGNEDCDLDLALFRDEPGPDGEYPLVAKDFYWQGGRDGDVPFAWVYPETVTAGTYFLTIIKWECEIEPEWIQLVAWTVNPLEYHSDGYHMGNPEETRNPGAVAVGATHYWDTSVIASYSSRGPTVDGRTKPGLTGVACAYSPAYFERPDPDTGEPCWFRGTGQAAGHVAGLAALVRERFPNYGPEDTVAYLKQNASDRGPAGADNTWGHGIAYLSDPAATPAITSTGNITVRDGENPGELIISWDAVPGATHYRVGYVNMGTDYPLITASPTGEWLEAFRPVDVNAANLTPANGRVEYTLRRLESGRRHAVTVLTSNDALNTAQQLSGRYHWPANPRWQFHTVP